MLVVKLEHCLLADKNHKYSLRAYCHVFHKRDEIIDGMKVKIICCAKAFWSLPSQYKRGLLYHELSHILRPDIVDELQVDKMALQLFGVKIIRRSSKKYGENLEYAQDI